jgi:hypothetical protein
LIIGENFANNSFNPEGRTTNSEDSVDDVAAVHQQQHCQQQQEEGVEFL